MTTLIVTLTLKRQRRIRNVCPTTIEQKLRTMPQFHNRKKWTGWGLNPRPKPIISDKPVHLNKTKTEKAVQTPIAFFEMFQPILDVVCQKIDSSSNRYCEPHHGSLATLCNTNNSKIAAIASVFTLTFFIVAISSSNVVYGQVERTNSFMQTGTNFVVEPKAPMAVSQDGNNVYIVWWTNKSENWEVMFRA